MNMPSFDIPFEQLPEDLPVFPLPRVLLLPRAQLPLNIFEPRYLAMVEDCLKDSRMIGMIQPRGPGDGGAEDDPSGLYSTGCAGRITSFSETDDGRYLITLRGICRFNVVKEVSCLRGYRRVAVDWRPYADDVQGIEHVDVCRESMIQTLQAYFDKMEMSCERLDNVRTMDCEKLISILSMVCPFSANEKQALLEAPSLSDRVDVLKALMEMALRGDGPSEGDDPAGGTPH